MLSVVDQNIIMRCITTISDNVLIRGHLGTELLSNLPGSHITRKLKIGVSYPRLETSDLIFFHLSCKDFFFIVHIDINVTEMALDLLAPGI